MAWDRNLRPENRMRIVKSILGEPGTYFVILCQTAR